MSHQRRGSGMTMVAVVALLLSIVGAGVAAPAGAAGTTDLAVQTPTHPGVLYVGGSTVLETSVSNVGTAKATHVRFTFDVAAGATVTDVTSLWQPATCTHTVRHVSCTVADLDPSSGATMPTTAFTSGTAPTRSG